MGPTALSRGSDSLSSAFPRLNVVAVAIFITSLALGLTGAWLARGYLYPLIMMVIIGVVLMQSPKVAQQWERAIVLRLGRFTTLRGPGLFWVIPFVETVSSWIDQRTITTSSRPNRP